MSGLDARVTALPDHGLLTFYFTLLGSVAATRRELALRGLLGIADAEDPIGADAATMDDPTLRRNLAATRALMSAPVPSHPNAMELVAGLSFLHERLQVEAARRGLPNCEGT